MNMKAVPPHQLILAGFLFGLLGSGVGVLVLTASCGSSLADA